jgi:heme-degrading monooxygenase HmoA
VRILVFEVEPKPGRAREYLDMAAALKSELEKIDGFISVERFESLANKGKYLSLSTWRDEAAIARWREHMGHRAAQKKGRDDIFADFRIRVAEVVRDYNLADAKKRAGKEAL